MSKIGMAFRMRVLSNLIGALSFMQAIVSQTVQFESQLNSIRKHARYSCFSSHRAWFSEADRRNFDAAQLSRRSSLEFQGRIPVAR